ncbi:DUF2922 domain-containing protein [Thermosinus carboxydivorans]|nr:DUF2922 domain-containing protein [Thermosinus carboxydivorans]
MTKTLELVFRNATGREVVISLADPRDDLAAAEAATVMEQIIAKNIFTTTGGDLMQPVEARIRIRDAVVLA